VECKNLAELSTLLSFAPQRLYYLSGNADKLYKNIKIPKRDVTSPHRRIAIPITELKGIQRTILTRILEKNPVSKSAYAYVKNKSATLAAKKVCNSNWVLKCDMKDFFPSITANRVFGLFMVIGFSKEAASILTKLTTYKGKLSQGAPTSPYISNLICKNMDRQLKKFAAKYNLEYLRYSDDLIFFGEKVFNKKNFLKYLKKIIF